MLVCLHNTDTVSLLLVLACGVNVADPADESLDSQGAVATGRKRAHGDDTHDSNTDLHHSETAEHVRVTKRCRLDSGRTYQTSRDSSKDVALPSARPVLHRRC